MKKTLLLLGLFAASLLGALLFHGPRAASPVVVISRGVAPAPHDGPAPLTPADWPAAERSVAGPIGEGGDPAGAGAAPDPPAAADTTTVHGALLDMATLAPLPGHRVVLRRPDPGGSTPHEGTSAEDGSFSIPFPPGPIASAELITATVYAPGRDRPIHRCSLVAAERIEVLVPPSCVLSGRFVTTETDAFAHRQVLAEALRPTGGSSFLARFGCDERAAFVQPVRVPGWARTIRLSVSDGSIHQARIDVPLQELMGPEGATIPCETTRVGWLCVDPDGAPIEGVTGTLTRRGERAGGIGVLSTDAEGKASATVERARYVVALVKQGFLTEVVELTGVVPVHVVLRPEPDPPVAAGLLRGRVVDESGRPVTGALVSATFSDDDDDFGAAVDLQMDESDARGEFRLEPARSGTYEVMAYKKGLGESNVGRVPADYSGRLEIVIEALATVELAPSGEIGHLPSFDGHFDCVIIDRRTRARHVTDLPSGPYLLPGLPRSDYTVFLRSSSDGLLGAVDIDAADLERDLRIPVAMFAPAAVTGTLVDTDGAPSADRRVRVVDPRVPEGVPESWLAVPTGPGGFFSAPVFGTTVPWTEVDLAVEVGGAWLRLPGHRDGRTTALPGPDR